MLTWIRRLLAPPVFAGDEDKTRAAWLLNIILLTLLARAVFIRAITWSQPPRPSFFVPFTLFLLAMIFLMRRGSVRWASVITVIGFWLSLTAVAVISGGIHSTGFRNYILPVLIAGLLLGRAAAMATAGLSILAGLGMWAAEIEGVITAPPGATASLELLTTHAISLLMAAVLVTLATRRIEEALERARQEIVERKQTEETLRLSEERFAKAFQASPEPIAIYRHRDATLLEVNERWTEIYGYTRREVIGRTALELQLVKPEDRQRLRQIMEEQGFARDFEIDLKNKQGEIRHISLSAEQIVIHDELCDIFLHRDITERQQAEEGLRASEERFSKAFNLSPLRMGIARIRDGVILDVNDCWVREMGFTREETIGQPILELTAWLGEEVPRVRQLLQDGRPIRNFEGQANTKSGEKRDTLVSAEVIELSGEPCLLWAANDITERKRAEEALRESEELFRTSFENATAGVCLVGTDGRFLSVNQTWCEMIGYTKHELEQLSFNDITPDEDKHIGATFVAQALSGGTSSAHFEKHYLHKDGHAIWAYVSTALVHQPEGKPRYFISYIQDITERKRAEQSLAASEALLRQFIKRTPAAVAMFDTEMRYLQASDRWLKDYHLEGQDIIGRSHYEVFPDIPDRWKKIHQRALAGAVERCDEDPFPRADGTMEWLQWEIRPWHNAEGVIGGLSMFTQVITERKRAETERLSLMHDLGERIKELTALHRTARLLQQDRPFDQALLSELVAWLPPAWQYPEICEARITYADLEVRTSGWRETPWKQAAQFTTSNGQRGTIEVVYLEERPPAAEGVFLAEERHLIQSLADMLTAHLERKLAEDSLHLSEERFRAAMYHSPIGMGLVAPDGRWVEVNPALCRIVGYTRQELLAIDFQTITHPDDLDTDLDYVRQMLARQIETYQMEKRYLHKDGHLIWIQLNVSLVWDVDGTPRNFISQIQDITERKLAERALLESNAKLLMAMDMAKLGHWEYDVATERFTFDENFYKLYGTTPAQEGGTLMSAADYARKFIPPAEAAIVAEEIGKALTTSDPHFTQQIEHRIKRADGSPGYMLVRYAIIKDAQGRTVKTYGANQDITERKQAEEQIKATSEQLRALMASLRSAREEEGIRIAREIHDELGSALTSVRWDLEEIDKAVSKAEDQALLPALRGKISAMFSLIDATIHVVRRISSELRPSILDDLGLAAAVEWQAQQFQARTGITCRSDCAVENPDLDPEQSTAVFRIFQETLTNVLRHAQATRIDVTLEKEGAEFVLRISDNGRGISDDEKTGQFSLGLLGMRERAHLIGAHIEITGIEGQGTTVTLRVPQFRSQGAVATV